MIKIGDKFNTKDFGEFTVVKYVNAMNITVKFEDGTEVVAKSANIVKGQVKNRNKPYVYGVGFLGYGQYKAYNENTPTKEYKAWFAMLQRCYDPNQNKRNPSYKNCMVAAEWHNFQNFASWYVTHRHYNKGFELDKDLTVVGNSVYSPATCDLVPKEVNMALAHSEGSNNKKSDLPTGICLSKTGKYVVQQGTGLDGESRWKGSFDTLQEAVKVFGEAKTARIRNVASKYRDVLSESVYSNLMQYKFKED